MNPSNVEWAAVCGIAQTSWVDEVPVARPESARSVLTASGAPDASMTMLTLLSLRKEMIEERLALNRHHAGQVDAATPHHHSSSTTAVLELVMDRMALKDCGECDGATQSPLAEFASLRRLTLNFNHLSKIHTTSVFNALLDLRELEIDFNKLSEFGPLKQCQRLEQLSVSHNVLVSLVGLALPRLHTLDVSHNKLGKEFVTAAMSKDPVLRLPNLTQLDVSHNNLTSLEWVGSLTKLTALRASHNTIASLQGVQTCLALEELDVSHNRLRFTATTQANNPLKGIGKSLQQLDVSFNDISSLAFFPPGTLTKVWSLSIANNTFHGSRKPLDDGSSVLRGPRRGSSSTPKTKGGPATTSGIFASDDIGDACYDDEGRGSVASRPSSRGFTPGALSTGRASNAPTPALSTSTRRGPSSDDAVTFLARLAQLFPALEILNVANNSEEIIADASDLRFLSKCTGLTELSIAGTLTLPPVGGRRGSCSSAECPHKEAVLTFLPQIEVLDGTVLFKREAVAVAVEDMESAGIHDSATLFSLSRPVVVRPTSAGGAALIRPGTSSQQKVNAIHSSKAKDDLEDFQREMEAFMHRAEHSRRKVHHIMDHMQRMTAWAYHDGPKPSSSSALEPSSVVGSAPTTEQALQEPAPLIMSDVDAMIEEALAAEEAVVDGRPSRGRPLTELSDSDDEQREGVDRLEVSPAEDSASQKPPVGAKQLPRPPSTKRGVGGDGGPHTSPNKQRLIDQHRSSSVQPAPRSNSSHAGRGVSGTTNVQQRSASTSQAAERSKHRSSSSSAASSSLYAESEAMKRIKSLPTSSFTLEQAKFKQELANEAEKRREQLRQFAKESSAKLPAPKPKGRFSGTQQLNVAALSGSTPDRNTSRPTTGKSETGTSMISPGKAAFGAPPPAGGAGERVTTSTATSPPKAAVRKPVCPTVVPPYAGDEAGRNIPKLNLALAEGSSRSPVLQEDEQRDQTPAMREPSTVVRDPRDVPRGDVPEEPSRDGTPINGTFSSSTPGGAPSLSSTARPLSATNTLLKRVDPNNGVPAYPKVNTVNKNSTANPLLKGDAIGSLSSRPVTKSVVPAFVDEGGHENSAGADTEATTYFSTKPVSASQPAPVRGGASLNRRGQQRK